MMKIGIDAMGGDFAPETVVMGAIFASSKIGSDSKIVLFGDKAQIETILEREKCPLDTFEIVPTTEVISMSDHPTQAFTKKSNSSITVGFNYLAAGKIDGFASAGNTGAMMVGCMYAVKQVEGVIRPAISSSLPTINGHSLILLDVGLNVDCKPEVLYQYGIIGSIYAKRVLHINNPRVALLNIGEEKEKGNNASKTTHEMMEGTKDFNFVGNIEAKHLFTGEVADVVVCDGFVGNTILKQSEGIYEIAVREGIKGTYFDNFNYENVGGTPVLGINAPVIIGHGCSSAKAICNMILQTEKTIRGNIGSELREILSK